MTPFVSLLNRARSAGLMLASEDGKLRVRGPRSAEPLVRQLLGRKDDVLAVLHVFNGTAPCLDWRRGRLLDQLQPCVMCHKSTLLVDPYDNQPMHKGCAEAAISPDITKSAPRSAA